MTTTLATPADKRKQAVARALDRAAGQAAIGNIPTLISTTFDGMAIEETWRVHSRSRSKITYTVTLTHRAAGITTRCDCAATSPCHHRAAARLASAGVIPYVHRAGMKIRPKMSATG